MPIPTRRRWLPWAIALGLAILQWRLLAGFENQHDLHPADEIHYLQQGLTLAAGKWPGSWLAWSPVESLAYALLHGIGVPAAARPDVMIVFGSVVGTLALFWCLLRRCGVAGALLAATSWATMPLPLVNEFPTLQPSTYLFSAALAWAGLGCLLRQHLLPGVLLLGCAAFDRGELAPALLLGGGGFAVLAAGGARRRGLLVGLVGLAILLFHAFGEGNRERTWLAFSQHYALGAVERDASVPGAGFEFPQPLMDRDFPGARSVVAALRTNPGAVGVHLRHNVGILPHSLDVLLLRPWHHAASWRWAWIGGLAALVGWIGLVHRRRWVRLVRRHRALLVALALAGLATLPTNLLIRPRASLSLAWVPFAGAMLGVTVRAWCRGRTARWTELALLLLLLGLLMFAPRPFTGDVTCQREVRLAVRLLQRADFGTGDRLAAVFGNRLLALAAAPSLAAFDLLELRNLPPDPNALAAAFQAADATWILTSPTAMLVLGPLAPLLEAELASDRWDLVDIALPVLLYQRAR